MIESNIPDIDVEELAKRVQVEADRLRILAPRRGNRRAPRFTLRSVPPLRSVPNTGGSPEFDLGAERLQALHDLLERARQATEVSNRIPKPFRWLFRKQARYNSLLIQSVIPLFESVSKLIQLQEALMNDLRTQNTWLTDVGRIISSLAAEQQSARDKLETDSAVLAAVRRDLGLLEQRYTSDASFIKAELSLKAALIQRLTDGVQPYDGNMPTTARSLTAPETAGPMMDSFYFSFENRFRGSRQEIKERLRFYLPFLETAGVGTEANPIVDLGCGRGEWLEILREQGLSAIGVDANEAMVTQCTERKLSAVRADALEWLRDLPDESHGAVSGFHIIEHLPLEFLIDLLGQTFRVLQPGGLAIFESPNCKNLMVGACNFNIDPTHRRPVFPETAQFMLETRGFEPVQLEYLSPVDVSNLEGIEEIPTALRELLFGPQDFAAIGYKPAAA